MTELIKPTAMSLDEKMRYAGALAESGLVPKQYQRQPPNVLVAVEYGEALGLHPMAALREINVINGSPSLSATLMMSLARGAGHKVRTHGDDSAASCTIVRKDDQDYEHTVHWDRSMAEQHGLWGKGHWQKNPALMLKYRAISECVRMACPEVLAGVKYTPRSSRTWGEARHPACTSVPATVPRGASLHPTTGARRPVADPIGQNIAAAWDDLEKLGKIFRSLGEDHPCTPKSTSAANSCAPKRRHTRTSRTPWTPRS
ncbi:recombinase RecT [Nesterenkonia pannonica]|uniref:recombinase RecT n=1 Tax=Nesterenkonia pannonica TaxID=1548602 RepID=UPI0021646618|nr:recombinase RecT [Nesterenkonia pannonica]